MINNVARAVAKRFFEGKRKMRKVLKTCRQIHISSLFSFVHEFVMRQIEPFFRKPLSGSLPEGFLKIRLECSEASACQISKLFQREVVHEVFLHVLFQVNPVLNKK